MRVFNFDYEIDRTSINRLIRRLRTSEPPTHVLVDSPGGEFDFFSTLGPAIERRGITTLAGDVRSAAIILYLLGYNRQSFPDSTFFFHEVRAHVASGGQITLTDIEEFEELEVKMSGEPREKYEEWKRNLQFAQFWFVDFITRKTGVSSSVFLSLMRGEATLSARDAVHYGIAHEIVPTDYFDRF